MFTFLRRKMCSVLGMNIDTDRTVSVTDLARKTSQVLNDVIDNDEPYTILKDNKFAAAVVPFEQYHAMLQRLETLQVRSQQFINERHQIPEGEKNTFQNVNGFPQGMDSITGPMTHISNTWEKHEGTGNLSVRLGMTESRRISKFGLGEGHHGGIGIHGSVGGDDPSIVMENMMAALAIRHCPADVNFAVLDASGSSTPLYDRNLKGLRHFVKTSNDLNDPEFHDALSTELADRESILRKYGVEDINRYRNLRWEGAYHLPELAHLFVMVLGPEDGDLPEDIAELLTRIARWGRAFGMYLLLDDTMLDTLDGNPRSHLKDHLAYSLVSNDGGHWVTLTTSDANDKPVVIELPTATDGAQEELTYLVERINDTAGNPWGTASLLSNRSNR